MIPQTLITGLALTGLIGSPVAFDTLSDVNVELYASAHTMEDRAAARAAARSSPTRTVTERPTRRSITQTTAASRRQARLNARRRTTETQQPTGDKTLYERMQERRNRRRAGQPVSVKQQVIDGVNLERAKHGLPPLRHQIDLERSAQLHAQDMKNRDYFSHENGNGDRSGDRIKETGYGAVNAQECRCSYKIYLGENIAKGQSTVAQVIEEWMASESHREAMLSKDYQEVGVGIVDDIWVLNFGRVDITPVR
ncbi:MAG: CAP domain-containing protein [Candidatus Peribacteraceae bacterium]|jgi:uncharacterized protein YkwD|nr:hypothetical protein [bacterium]MDP6561535.1 CAP domain-containing protein [Candidatus Peribacteraceae bacterium]|tara:strand:+ start:22046 stop:22804 length:759 start_codon:yes stop_codon:yes gene_type:complete